MDPRFRGDDRKLAGTLNKMIDANKMQNLTQLVQTSSILNAQEKAEWLSLMGLMNDKQLSELEEILKSSGAAITGVTTGPSPTPTSHVDVPSLSHLSNLPNRMVDPRLNPKPPKSILPNGPEKDFAARSTLRPMSSPKQPEQPAQPQISAQPKEPFTLKPPAPVQVTPTRPTISSPILSAEAAAAGLKLMALSDVEKLTAEALHHQNRANFFAAISALAEKEGYFQVLGKMEESPLYQDYLNYGKLILSGSSGDHLPLSQEEFEFVTDLLQALKINRV